MRDSDWSRENLLRSDWLLLKGATITTHENENNFHIKGWALNLVLIQRPGGTWKWPIFSLFLVAIPQIYAQLNRSGFLLVSYLANAEQWLQFFSKFRSRCVKTQKRRYIIHTASEIWQRSSVPPEANLPLQIWNVNNWSTCTLPLYLQRTHFADSRTLLYFEWQCLWGFQG